MIEQVHTPFVVSGYRYGGPALRAERQLLLEEGEGIDGKNGGKEGGWLAILQCFPQLHDNESRDSMPLLGTLDDASDMDSAWPCAC
jgi:hypothetical protein